MGQCKPIEKISAKLTATFWKRVRTALNLSAFPQDVNSERDTIEAIERTAAGVYR